MQKRLRRSDSGFTLAEVLVAVIIAVLVIVPMLSSFIMGRIGTEIAKHRTQAMNLIRARLEYLNSQGYNYIDQLSPGDCYENLSLDESEGGETLSCARTTTVSDVDGDDLLEVEVTVSWRERRLGSESNVSESVMELFAPTRVFE